MENYPKKIDQFTDFAKKKLNDHTTLLSNEMGQHDSVEFKSEVFHLHKQSFEMELLMKVNELDSENEILREPLNLLKEYYLEVFETSIHH